MKLNNSFLALVTAVALMGCAKTDGDHGKNQTDMPKNPTVEVREPVTEKNEPIIKEQASADDVQVQKPVVSVSKSVSGNGFLYQDNQMVLLPLEKETRSEYEARLEQLNAHRLRQIKQVKNRVMARNLARMQVEFISILTPETSQAYYDVQELKAAMKGNKYERDQDPIQNWIQKYMQKVIPAQINANEGNTH